MKTTNNQLPANRVVLDTIGGKTTATLWDGTYTEHKTNADPEYGNQSAVEYEYTLYQITVQMRPGLKEAIESNFDCWYAMAAEQETTENKAKEAEKIEREMNGNILSTLLDYDFRLMMLEERGNL